ncbi:AraC family transcriptional regulator [Spirochaeta isovalerica]|uniref:AraC-like DNA-binding protein/mannose-6-phosphate isomerase-like protein (Cupin superfamily) n=1 Tax=Spirochaeta isovalerica TaxID=150 RepID=A0A841REG0_9SPIO|nr:AraC family transcriptional regulator [Spirochaeta isovalerica]MBB6481597.1 AraC-like DNA-binding protein/mannose-6-phosphate isomerase-like protein (cupin superfamily) [Spirochaeta isovalerica]
MEIKDAVFVYQMIEEKEVEWHSRIHNHDQREYEIHYFLQGEGKFRTGATTYNISKGSLFLTAPFEEHTITSTNLTRPLTYYAVLIKTDPRDFEIEDLLRKELQNSNYYNIGTNYRFFFEELREKGLSENSNLRKSAYHQLLSFLYQLSEDELMTGSGNRESVHIEKALMMMQNNIFSEVTLADITEKLKITDAYFIRLFKKKMKTTPMKYYTKLKVEAGASMLISSSLKVYEIADRLNFYSEFHFSRVFKQHTGVSPRQYRNEYRQITGNS